MRTDLVICDSYTHVYTPLLVGGNHKNGILFEPTSPSCKTFIDFAPEFGNHEIATWGDPYFVILEGATDALILSIFMTP